MGQLDDGSMDTFPQAAITANAFFQSAAAAEREVRDGHRRGCDLMAFLSSGYRDLRPDAARGNVRPHCTVVVYRTGVAIVLR